MAKETFKILNELAPPVLSDLLVKKETRYNFRYLNILQVPQVKRQDSVRTRFAMLPQYCGILYLTILEQQLISANLKHSFLTGVERTVYA